MLNVVLSTDTVNTFILSLGHSWTALHLHKNRNMHRTKFRKGVYHVTVYYLTLIIYRVCHDVCGCVKGGCSLSSLKWKVNGQYWWGIFLSQQMLPVIKHVVDDNITCLSATQRMHAPVNGAYNTVQQLLCKTLNFISPELWPQQAQLITWFRESIAANMSCKSTKLKKSSSDWLKSEKALIQYIWVKICDFRVLSGNAEALVRWGGNIK